MLIERPLMHGKGPSDKPEAEESFDKLTSSKLAQKLGMKTNEFVEKIVASGYLEARDDKHYLTAKGKEAGGEFRMSPKFGTYFPMASGLQTLTARLTRQSTRTLRDEVAPVTSTVEGCLGSDTGRP